MNHLQLIGLIACAVFFASCETTDTASTPNGKGNQESKRLAALQELRAKPQPDEAEKNLWNAEHDVLNRDGNPNAGR